MSDKITFSPRDTELIVIAMKCAKDPKGLQVDYEKMACMAKLRDAKCASTIWSNVKKKLMAAHTGDADDTPTTPNTASKAKAAPKKRAPAKTKAKVGVEDDTEGDNGIAADDEQTPGATPKKRAGAKRKAADQSSPMKAEDSDEIDEEVAAQGEKAVTDGSPAKKKRTHNRKPKDPNAASPKPRAKKGAKGASASAVNNDDDANNVANNQLAQNASTEGAEDDGEQPSIFGNGNIKVEGPDELDEYEQYQAQKIIDEQTFGSAFA